MESYTIREITSEEVAASARIVRRSFRTVANEFGFTRESAPTHPSFAVTAKALRESGAKGVKHFGLFLGGRQVGFVAAEKAGNGVFYLERLAVLPAHRHKGYGEALVEFVFDHAKKNGGSKVSIGIIDEHTVLKNWYKTLGFRETGTRDFAHLPFRVCFMEKSL